MDEPWQKPQDPRNWHEDFAHENGQYVCECVKCGCMFLGHKRRVACKRCVAGQDE